MSAPGLTDSPTTLVVAGTPFLPRAVAGLVDQGHRVSSVDIGSGLSEDEADAAFARAASELGGLDLVLCAPFEAAAWRPRALAELTDSDWQRGVEAPLDLTRWLTRAVIRPLTDRRGTLVFIVPTVGLVGGAGYSVDACASEGIRGWAKSLAKQWGEHKVRVHCVAIALQHLSGDSTHAPERLVQLVPPALGSVGDARAELAPVFAMLSAPALGFVTGSTLVVDGGLYMGL